jgi:very-short-patch-repair endonuclease
MNKNNKIFPYNPKLKQYARENRVGGNPAEIKMWTHILSIRELIRYKWTRQKPISSYILDFYCTKLKMAIEIDGDSHAEKEEYDQKRSELLNIFEILVIRYAHHDVLNNIGGIYDDLKERIIEREKSLGFETKF